MDLAAEMEGHPDNSTPALLGGFVAAAMEENHVYCAQCPVPEGLALWQPLDFELKTADARRALPDQYDRADGVYNLSRSALMAISMAQGKLENLRIAAQDRLHQPYRLGLIPGAEQVFDFFNKQQAYTAYISGAGSTLMGLVPMERMDSICRAARDFLDAQGLPGWKVLGLHPGEGARIVTSLACAMRWSVVLPCADTTTTTCMPASTYGNDACHMGDLLGICHRAATEFLYNQCHHLPSLSVTIRAPSPG